MHLRYLVQKQDNGLRAVDVLRQRMGMSRLMCKRVRLYGRLICNGHPQRMIDPVQTGDTLDAYLNDDSSPSLNQDIPVEIRYRDDWILIANKPAQMVTHPNWMYHKGSLTDLLSDKPLHPVTRLDRNTSGVVLIALNGHAHYVVSQKPMIKEYIALVHGRFRARSGLIQAPIKRAEHSIIERIVHREGAKAKTIWQELRYFSNHDVSLVRLRLLTGRTHQIRVHCQAADHPLLGDSMYGLVGTKQETELDRKIERQALHAAKIQFIHPIDQIPVTVSAPLPQDMKELLRLLFC